MFKLLAIFFLCFNMTVLIYGQQKDSILQHDSLSIADSSLHSDSVAVVHDSIQNLLPAQPKKVEVNTLKNVLKENIFLNVYSAPVSELQVKRKFVSKDALFYIGSVILLFLGILKVAWSKYFTNLVRVFFNSSLRQGQLTDQLLQARLPSMFFNLFFILIGSWYVYLLLYHAQKIGYDNWKVLLLCVSGLSLIYIIKFCTIKFTGWLTGYEGEADTYIFIVFLINKIIAICLVPVVIIISFSNPELANAAIIISYIIIALMFIMRFLRSYGLLQNKLKLSGFHFLLYILGFEILPLFLIYKGALVIMGKTL